MRSSHPTLPTAIVVTVALLFLPAASAGEWTGWLGPGHNGVSPEKNIFGAAKPKLDLVWSKKLGKAYSGISVADGKAVTMFGDGETDWLVAMNAADGKEIWRYRIDEMFPKIGGADGGQLSMPVIDGKVVYGLGAKGQLFAIGLADGKEIWSLRIDQKLGAIQPHFGFTTTPLIVGDLLVVQTGGDKGRSITALDKKTGERRWSTGDEKVGYQSPVLVELAGKEQIIVVTNVSVAGLVPENGKVLWRIEHDLVENDGWSTPVKIGESSFVLTARYKSAAYRVTEQSNGFAVKEMWRGTDLKGNFAMPVAYKDHLYGYDADFLACLEVASGKQVWKTRADAAGMVLVDGHLVIFDMEGAVVIAEASPAGYKEKVRVKVAERAGFTFPSFSDGGIYVRNLESIARVDVGR